MRDQHHATESATPDRHDPEVTARLELRALEKMIRTLCEHTEQLTQEARARGRLRGREGELQMEAFAERRQQAVRQLENDAGEPAETRIARLDRLVEALDCSRTFFLETCRASAD